MVDIRERERDAEKLMLIETIEDLEQAILELQNELKRTIERYEKLKNL